MAKTEGAGFSLDMRGKIGGVTHRGHGDQRVASNAKTYFTKKPHVQVAWEPGDDPNIQFWHRTPEKLTLRTAPGQEFVSNWGDKTNYHRDYIQATQNAQPEFFNGGSNWNGRSWIEFDGIDDLLLSLVFPVTISQPAMVFLICNEPEGITIGRHILGLRSGSTDGLRWANIPPLKYEIKLSAGTCRTGYGDGKVKLWSLTFNFANSSIRWNNRQQGITGNVGTAAINQISLASRTSLGNYSKIKVFEDFCIKGPLNELTMIRAFKYCACRYGI